MQRPYGSGLPVVTEDQQEDQWSGGRIGLNWEQSPRQEVLDAMVRRVDFLLKFISHQGKTSYFLQGIDPA